MGEPSIIDGGTLHNRWGSREVRKSIFLCNLINQQDLKDFDEKTSNPTP
jgi:hypothetical protein